MTGVSGNAAPGALAPPPLADVVPGVPVVPSPRDEPEATVEQRSARGVGWMGLGQVLRQLVQLGLFVGLARLLDPRDFGVMALVLVVTGFAVVIGEMGLESALVARRDVTPVDLSTVFWTLLIVNGLLAGALAALADPIAELLRAPDLQGVLVPAAAVFPLTALAVVPRVVCARALRFRPVAVAETGAVVVGGASAVVLAATGAGVAALVAQQLVTAGLSAVFLLATAGWRPTMQWRWASLARCRTLALGVVGFNSVNYWSRNADNLLVGRVLGAGALGLYQRAYLVLLLPVTQVAQVLGRVMLSSLSRLQDDVDRVRALYLRTIGLIALVVTPLMWLAAVLAEPLVRTAFGPAWLDVVVPMQVLTAVGPLQAVATTVGWIYQARGRADLYFRFGLLAAVANVAAITVGVALGDITSVAVAYAVMSVGVLFVPTVAVPGRLIDMRVVDVVRAIGAPLVAGAVMVAAVALVDRGLGDGAPWLRLVLGTATGLVVYVGLLVRLRSAALSDIHAAMRSRLSRRDAPATSL